ncbi:MAG: hypothetical protein KUG77_02965, partial [Nannocystaceae bacterium]|nr:hypothetical protein [Nannocystaceae bacterium]
VPKVFSDATVVGVQVEGLTGEYDDLLELEESLRRWLDVFPREQVAVVRTEDLAEAQAQARVLEDLCGFLGLNPFNFSRVGSAKLNVASSVARDEQTAATLRAYFAPSTERLERLLGRSMAWD